MIKTITLYSYKVQQEQQKRNIGGQQQEDLKCEIYFRLVQRIEIKRTPKQIQYKYGKQRVNQNIQDSEKDGQREWVKDKRKDIKEGSWNDRRKQRREKDGGRETAEDKRPRQQYRNK